MTTTRLRTLAALAAVSAALLSGCGTVSGWNPGVAARVGDDTVSLDRVDDVATAYCSAAEKQFQQGQALAGHYVRGEVAGSLALRAAAQQLVQAYGVSVDPSYAQAEANARTSLSSMPADERDAVIAVQGAQAYLNAAELSVGRAVLGSGSASQKQLLAAGRKALRSWLDDHDVRIDPRFGVDISSGRLRAADTSVSYPVGDTAKTADASQPDATYAAGLPDTQRCG